MRRLGVVLLVLVACDASKPAANADLSTANDLAAAENADLAADDLAVPGGDDLAGASDGGDGAALWSPPADTGSLGTPVCPCGDVASLTLSDGHVEIYAHASDGSLYRIWEDAPDGNYFASNSQRLWQPASAGLSVVSFATSPSGAVQLFTVAGGEILQFTGPSWSQTPINLGAPSAVTLSAPLAFLDQGAATLQLFAVGSDGAIWHRTDDNNNVWSAWASLGPPGSGAGGTLAAALQIDGKMALFARDGAGVIWYALQTSAGAAFGAFQSLGGSLNGSPSAAVDLSGKISIYAVGSDKGIWTNSQTTVDLSSPSPFPWTGWSNLSPVRPGGELFGAPLASVEDDGAVHLDYIDYQPAGLPRPGYNLAETIQFREGDWLGNGSNAVIDSGGRIAAGALASAREIDGRIATFRLDSAGNILFKRPTRPTAVVGATTWVGTVEGGLEVFRGIPYASQVAAPSPSPVPFVRWKPPIAPSPPTGRVDAYAFGHACWSGNGASKPGVTFGEDCLNLNVYAPEGASNLPVVVFLHGGGNSNYAQMFTLEPLARNGGLVVVTVDFRIGAFGLLGLHELTVENGSSSNFMLMDIAAALEWVHANVGAFGGDPSHVVAVGTSGGGDYLEALLSSPLLPPGTISGAVMDSSVFDTPGTPFSAMPAVSLSDSEQSGISVASALGCAGDTLTCLRNADPAALASASSSLYASAALSVMPTVDGVTLPSDPPAWLSTHATVPLVIGSTKSEQGTSINANSDSPYAGFCDSWFYSDVSDYMCNTTYYAASCPASSPSPAPCLEGQTVDSLYTFGPAGAWPDSLQAEVQFLTDFTVTCPIRTLALDVVAAPSAAPVYRYLFTHVLENDRREANRGAFHSETNAFFFGSTGIVANHDHYVATAEENTLSDNMIGYLASFAMSGNPNNASQPAWPAFDASSESSIVLDTQVTTVDGYVESACTALGW